jgi:Spx/MgsR family transcriptional regulator
MALTMYGIKNCDTVKKARAWLDAAGIAYDFHDFKAKGAEKPVVAGWVAALGWEVVLNRAGTTFRGLPDSDKAGIDAEKAIALMVAQPSMVKRPVLAGPGVLLVGFKPELYAGLRA